MTPKELIDLCKAPVDGLDGKPVVPDHIYLSILKRSLPGCKTRLSGRYGPLGVVCNVASAEPDAGYPYRVTAAFNRAAVIRFLESSS